MTNVRLRSEDGVSDFRGPSVAIFGDLEKIRQDAALGKCAFYDNDFVVTPTLASATAQGEFYSYQDTSVTIEGKGINDLGEELGVLQIATLDTDNDEGSVQFGQTNQWRIGNSSGNTGKFGFEVRLKCDELTANQTGIMCGLVEGTLVTQISVDDTAEIKTSTSFLGFRGLVADPQNLDFGFQDTGGSALVVAKANAATLVEGTYTRLGFLYDPNKPDDKKITAFVNGTAVGYVNTTQIDTSTFPEDEGLVPFVLGKTFGSGSDATVDIDRVTFFQYMDSVQG